MDETLGIAGAGTIACGLAAAAARDGRVLLWARSDASAERARATVKKACSKLEDIIRERGSRHQARRPAQRHVLGRGDSRAPRPQGREMLADLGELARHAGKGAVLRRRPPRSRSPSSQRPAATPRASSGCTCSTRCRGCSSSSWRSRRRPATGHTQAVDRLLRGARQDPGRGPPTSPGSSSTASCSHTSSAPYQLQAETGMPAKGRSSTPA